MEILSPPVIKMDRMPFELNPSFWGLGSDQIHMIICFIEDAGQRRVYVLSLVLV